MKYLIIMTTCLSMFTAAHLHAMEEMNNHEHNSPQHAHISGQGNVVSVSVAKTSIILKHEPIAALGWPAMTMNFKVASKVNLGEFNKGDKVQFILNKESDEYVISAIKKSH